MIYGGIPTMTFSTGNDERAVRFSLVIRARSLSPEDRRSLRDRIPRGIGRRDPLIALIEGSLPSSRLHHGIVA